MPKARIKSKMNIPIPASLLGLLVSWAITVIMLCLGAVFVENEYIEIDLTGILTAIIVFLASAAGCLISKITDKSNALMNIIIVSGSYIMSLLICAMLFFDGITGQSLVEIPAVLTGALIALFVGNKEKNNIALRRRRKIYR